MTDTSRTSNSGAASDSTGPAPTPVTKDAQSLTASARPAWATGPRASQMPPQTFTMLRAYQDRLYSRSL
jgi:hypothetical protein